MTSTHEERECDSPLVRSVWRHSRDSDGVYTAAADGSWDLLFVRRDENTTVLLAGPTSLATAVTYVKGSEYFGIRFELGAFLPHVSAGQLRNRTVQLPNEGKAKFCLGRSVWELPTYENVEGFVTELARLDLVVSDPVVVAALSHEQTSALSLRSVQRHFLQTTGMTGNYIRQIERAHHAFEFLQQGLPILTVVDRCGYADQSHLTKSLKHFIGRTPTQVVRAGQDLT
jgi:AraC-like DNA-binding protein